MADFPSTPRDFGSVDKTNSVLPQEQETGDCFAHSAARCLVRVLQQCYFPKYHEKAEALALYDEIHDYIVSHLGGEGGSHDRALRLCLGLDSDSSGISGDLYRVRDHVELRGCFSVDQVREAVDSCRRPCFSFHFKNTTQWRDFTELFRGPNKASVVFSRRNVRDAFYPDAHSGHAVNIRAYDPARRCFECVNTWGTDWGDGGKFRVAEDDLLTPGVAFDKSQAIDVRFKGSLPPPLQANVARYQRCYAKVSRSDLRALFTIMDKDGNGEVSMREFVMAGGWGTLHREVAPDLQALQSRLLDMLFYLHFEAENHEKEIHGGHATPEQLAVQEKLLSFPKVRDQDQKDVLTILFAKIDGSDKGHFTYRDLETFFEATLRKRNSDPLAEQFVEACKNGFVSLARDILRAAPPNRLAAVINCADDNGGTALVWACLNGHDRVVALLVKEPSLDVNKQHPDTGLTALHYAVNQGSLSCLELVLEVPGVQVNITSRVGSTPLRMATQPHRKEEMIKLLRSHGGVISTDWPGDKVALAKAFQLACSNLSADDLADMLALRPEQAAFIVSWQDASSDNDTALHALCSSLQCRGLSTKTLADQLNCLRVVTAVPRTEPNYLNLAEQKTGRTPLHVAIVRGNWAVAEALIKLEGLDLNAGDASGETALSASLGTYTLAKDCSSFIAALLEHPAILPKANDARGIKAWREAMAKKREEEEAAALAVLRAENKVKWQNFYESTRWLLIFAVPVIISFLLFFSDDEGVITFGKEKHRLKRKAQANQKYRD